MQNVVGFDRERDLPHLGIDPDADYQMDLNISPMRVAQRLMENAQDQEEIGRAAIAEVRARPKKTRATVPTAAQRARVSSANIRARTASDGARTRNTSTDS